NIPAKVAAEKNSPANAALIPQIDPDAREAPPIRRKSTRAGGGSTTPAPDPRPTPPIVSRDARCPSPQSLLPTRATITPATLPPRYQRSLRDLDWLRQRLLRPIRSSFCRLSSCARTCRGCFQRRFDSLPSPAPWPDETPDIDQTNSRFARPI